MKHQETLTRVREMAKVLQNIGCVKEFDEALFGMLVERIRVIDLVRVEFTLRSGVGVSEIL